jgi:4'-phosphopantetheinyl transferase
VDPSCTVWWAGPVAPAAAPGLVALLDAHERERLDRFRRPDDQARYLAAHALTRLVLGRVLEVAPHRIELDRTCRCGQQHGKPRLADADAPGFSLTHAGDVVGVAVHAGPVGLDVERVRELSDLPSMARHVRSSAEEVAGTTGFFRLWTRKEALLKATGDGLATPMSAITLDGPAVRAWTGPSAPDGPVWLRDLRPPAAGYVGALAGPGPVAPTVFEADGSALLVPG